MSNTTQRKEVTWSSSVDDIINEGTREKHFLEPKCLDIDPPFPELIYKGSTGQDIGISTAGFRSQKHNLEEAQEANYVKYYQAFVDRNNAEKCRIESEKLIKETATTTVVNQTKTTNLIKNRLLDVQFWETELEREINDKNVEYNLLCAQRKRLENAILTFDIPLHIATDNLNARDRRYGIDRQQDIVEIGLIKEVDIINKMQDLIKKAIKQTDKQLQFDKAAIENLELDWSDKKEADEYETENCKLNNNSTNKQFFPGRARFQEIMSTPQSWGQYSHDNIVRSELERMASIQLRTLIDNFLVDCTRDLQAQADHVEVGFVKRLDELNDAKCKMQESLSKICTEITKTEKNIENLKEAIRDKDNAIKVAQTRLFNKEKRPGIDLCRDAGQVNLINEVEEIQQVIDALTKQVQDSETSLNNLIGTRMTLEKEIQYKILSINIDQNCMKHRTRYPSAQKLKGYVNV